VGGEGGGDCQGGRPPAKTTIVKDVTVSGIRVRVICFNYYGHLIRTTDTVKIRDVIDGNSIEHSSGGNHSQRDGRKCLFMLPVSEMFLRLSSG